MRRKLQNHMKYKGAFLFATLLRAAKCSFVFAIYLGLTSLTLMAQIGGQGAVEGTITDPTGALIPNATIKATNVKTNESFDRQSTSSGFYVISPLSPGEYRIEASAPGFTRVVQENVIVNGMEVRGIDLKLQVGESSQTVTVSDAPPQIESTNATLGETMDNETYASLPLVVNGAPRDPTSFVYLQPGAVHSGTSGAFNGGQGYNDEVYLEGVPITSPSETGKPTSISLGASIEAIDQFQVKTSGTSAMYQGEGAQNYVLKSGTNTYHGNLHEFFRNTALDTWGFSAPASINKITKQAIKPVEHQNEYGGTFGGPVPGPMFRNRWFFYGSYDATRYLKGSQPSSYTIPTDAMRQGDFSAYSGSFKQPVFDPTSTVCKTSSDCSRQQFAYNGASNVIDPSRISPIAKYLQQFLPEPTNSSQTGNYIGSIPIGTNYYTWSVKSDFDVNSQHRISVLYMFGHKEANPSCCDSSGLPQPYISSVGNSGNRWSTVLSHTWTINPSTVNQLKYAVVRGGGCSINSSQGDSKWSASAAGIKNIIPGQASDAFPGVSFGSLNAPTSWATSNTANCEYQNTFVLMDAVQMTKGKHSISYGFDYQWLEDNNTSVSTGTVLGFTFSSAETSTYKNNSSTLDTSTGAGYASYLLGAVDSASMTDDRPAVTTGARYKNFSPFIQDDWRLFKNLTINLGLRWDYYSPFSEVQNRMSFVNVDMQNPVAAGALGALQFAGDGEYSCHCSNPVNAWHRNFGPRVGFAYTLKDKTVVRGSYSIVYSHAGGVGGRNGGRNGTGQLGFTSSANPDTTDSGQTPAFYLDSGFPSYQVPPFLNPAYGTGYTTIAGYTGSPQTVTWADPRLGGRAPYLENFNFGVQRALTSDLTASVDYSGSLGRFLGTSMQRTSHTNQLDPVYYSLGGLLTQQASTANIQAAQRIMPGIALPFASFSPTATIGQMLRPFPQYNGFTDVWGDIGASAYNSLQATLSERAHHGLSFTVNYTFSRMLDNTGSGRSAYRDELEWSRSVIDVPHTVSAYGVYQEPFGHRKNSVVNQVIRDWAVSGIYTFRSGSPLALTATGCNNPFSGTCEPNVNSAYNKSPRVNGGWGSKVLANNLQSISFIDKTAFSVPSSYTIGNSARTAPFNLYGPNNYDIDMSLRRIFRLYKQMKLTMQGDVFNLTNHTVFGGIGTTVGSSTFGTVSSIANTSRDIQISAHLDF